MNGFTPEAYTNLHHRYTKPNTIAYLLRTYYVLLHGRLFFRLYVNSWGKEKPIERKKQVVKNETERSEVEFSLPAFARWVIEICTEYENGSV